MHYLLSNISNRMNIVNDTQSMKIEINDRQFDVHREMREMIDKMA